MKKSTMLIFDAIEQGSLPKVRKAIRDGARVEDVDESTGMTPLAQAAELGNLGIVDLLLRVGANPELGGSTTPLEAAVLESHHDVVTALIMASSDVNRAVEDGFTPLMTAVSTGDIDLVRMLLEAGANPVAVNAEGESALTMAETAGKEIIATLLRGAVESPYDDEPSAMESFFQAIHNRDLEQVEELLEQIDLKARDRLGWTVLARAAQEGDPDIVEALLEAGAEVDFGGPQTPLYCALEQRHENIAGILLEHGAKAEGKKKQAPPLIAAVTKGHLEGVKLLLEHQAEPKGCDEEGVSALVLAARNGHEEVFRELAAHYPKKQLNMAEEILNDVLARRRRAAGETAELIELIDQGAIDEVEEKLTAGVAELDGFDEEGNTLLMAAAETGKLDLMRKLVAAGADLNARDETSTGHTALIRALRSGSAKRTETVSFLAEAGANIHLSCRKGMTPLMHAAEGDLEVETNGYGFAPATTVLIALGADLEARDPQGSTVWMQMKRNALGASTMFSTQRRRRHQMLRFLENAGASKVDNPVPRAIVESKSGMVA